MKLVSIVTPCYNEEENVEAMIQWCRHGPPSAHVTELIVQMEEFRGEFQSFSILF